MLESLLGFLWVALGGAIGGPARFFISGLVARRIGETFPWGTLFVNASGAFVLGLFAAYAHAHGVSSASSPWIFLVAGLLGSYTTVSSFSLQTLALARDGDRLRAAGNAVLSLALCLGAVACGFALGDRLNR